MMTPLSSRERLWLLGYFEEKHMTFSEVTIITLSVDKHPLLILFTNVKPNCATSWNVQSTNYVPDMRLLEVFSCRVSADIIDGLKALKPDDSHDCIFSLARILGVARIIQCHIVHYIQSSSCLTLFSNSGCQSCYR